MKKLYFLTPVIAMLIFASCTKTDYYPNNSNNERDWVQTHDHGTVAYVDYNSGNYIVDTHNGFTVVESWGNASPAQYDDVYAYFSSRGSQSIYNLSAGYFMDGRIIDSWLSWDDAMQLLDQLNYGSY